eukprot:Opistho-2@75938
MVMDTSVLFPVTLISVHGTIGCVLKIICATSCSVTLLAISCEFASVMSTDRSRTASCVSSIDCTLAKAVAFGSISVRTSNKRRTAFCRRSLDTTIAAYVSSRPFILVDVSWRAAIAAMDPPTTIARKPARMNLDRRVRPLLAPPWRRRRLSCDELSVRRLCSLERWLPAIDVRRGRRLALMSSPNASSFLHTAMRSSCSGTEAMSIAMDSWRWSLLDDAPESPDTSAESMALQPADLSPFVLTAVISTMPSSIDTFVCRCNTGTLPPKNGSLTSMAFSLLWQLFWLLSVIPFVSLKCATDAAKFLSMDMLPWASRVAMDRL